MENNPELKSVGAIFRKYVEIKTPPCIIRLIKSHENSINGFKKRINELNPTVVSETGQNLNKINKISDWFKKNSDNINFKIGQELYDIIHS